MLHSPRNTHWFFADEVLGLATDRKSFNIHGLTANHRDGREATSGVESSSAITSREASATLISVVGDPDILPLCV